MSNCIFCKIINNEIPSEKVFENEFVLTFKDINPQAPTHFLVVPKVHFESAAQVTRENSVNVAKCFEAIAQIAAKNNLENFRIINNCGVDAGQTVMHLHFHVLAGSKLGEKLI